MVGGHLVRLRWEQVHDNRPLVLLFGLARRYGRVVRPLVAAGHRRGSAACIVAVVCRNNLDDVLTWANGPLPSATRAAPLAFPLIADPDGRIASLYGLAAVGRGPTWGHFVIDPPDIIREVGVSGFPYWPGVEELLRSVPGERHPDRQGAVELVALRSSPEIGDTPNRVMGSPPCSDFRAVRSASGRKNGWLFSYSQASRLILRKLIRYLHEKAFLWESRLEGILASAKANARW